jgi:hypothetical protein
MRVENNTDIPEVTSYIDKMTEAVASEFNDITLN